MRELKWYSNGTLFNWRAPLKESGHTILVYITWIFDAQLLKQLTCHTIKKLINNSCTGYMVKTNIDLKILLLPPALQIKNSHEHFWIRNWYILIDFYMFNASRILKMLFNCSSLVEYFSLFFYNSDRGSVTELWINYQHI